LGKPGIASSSQEFRDIGGTSQQYSEMGTTAGSNNIQDIDKASTHLCSSVWPHSTTEPRRAKWSQLLIGSILSLFCLHYEFLNPVSF
jgi:hypothetical protein